MFRLDVFNNSFEYVSAVMIDDHQSIDLDYLTYSPYTIRCKEIEAQKGFFTHITDEDNNTIADGIIADIKPEKKTQTITIRPLNALFDAAVFYTPVSDAISWLASNIQQAFMTNSDTYQNRPINLTYTVASEQLPLTGYNLHETVNILSVMISALKTYGVVVESTLDLVNKKIRVNIFRQEASKTILADLENLISSQVTIGDPFGSTNKATLRKIRVNDDESTTVLGDFNFFLHPDGSIDQSNTNRIQPVFWEMETMQLEDDMTDAQWLAAATARAKEILEPAKFDNEIILRYQQADKLVYPLELPIGAQCEIHLKGEIYASLLTGKALEGKTVTLYFGVVRTDLTKQLSIKNRETFSFESTVKAVMNSVAENYPSKSVVADTYVKKTGDTMTGNLNIDSNNIDQNGERPTENQYGTRVQFRDKDGYAVSQLRLRQLTDGKLGLGILIARVVNGSIIQHNLNMFIDEEGNRTVSLSDGAAFRSAINAAPLASPAFTGNPTAPTQAAGNNSTRLATTAFVYNEVHGKRILGTQLINFSTSASIAVGSTGTATGTITAVDGATDYIVFAAWANYCTINNVTRSGLTLTATLRNVSNAAHTLAASVRVLAIG